MPGVVRGSVPDCGSLVYKRTFSTRHFIDRKDLKQTVVRGGTKLTGRNIHFENVGKVLKTGASDRRKTDGREFVADSLMDWKPVKCIQKWGNMVKF